MKKVFFVFTAAVLVLISCSRKVYVEPPKNFVFLDTNLYKDTVYFLTYIQYGDSSLYQLWFSYYKDSRITSYTLSYPQTIHIDVLEHKDNAWYLKSMQTVLPFFQEPVTDKIKKDLYFDESQESYGRVNMKTKSRHKEDDTKTQVTSKFRSIRTELDTIDFWGKEEVALNIYLKSKIKTKYKLFGKKYKNQKKEDFKYVCVNGLGIISVYTQDNYSQEVVDTLSKEEFVKLYKLLYMPSKSNEQEKRE